MEATSNNRNKENEENKTMSRRQDNSTSFDPLSHSFGTTALASSAIWPGTGYSTAPGDECSGSESCETEENAIVSHQTTTRTSNENILIALLMVREALINASGSADKLLQILSFPQNISEATLRHHTFPAIEAATEEEQEAMLYAPHPPFSSSSHETQALFPRLLDVKCHRKNGKRVCLSSSPTHTGNMLLEQLIEENQCVFDCAVPKHKVLLVQDVVESIKGESNVGRFLAQTDDGTWIELGRDDAEAVVFAAFWKGRCITSRLRPIKRLRLWLEHLLAITPELSHSRVVRSALNEFLDLCPRLGVRSVEIQSNAKNSIASTLLIQANAPYSLRPGLRTNASSRSVAVDAFHIVVKNSWYPPTGAVKSLQELLDCGHYPQLSQVAPHDEFGDFRELLRRILSQNMLVEGTTELRFRSDQSSSRGCGTAVADLCRFIGASAHQANTEETIRITVKWHPPHATGCVVHA